MIDEYDSLFKSMKNEIKASYTCPECNYYIEEDTEICPKCETEIDWSDNNVSNTDYDDDDEDDDEEISTSNNYASSSQSDNSGCLVFFIVGIIIFIIIIIAANS